MEKNEFVKSEIGSEAAWRGFSTQTLYIARRIDSRRWWTAISGTSWRLNDYEKRED